MILSLRVLSWWLAHVGLRVCSCVVSLLLRPLEFCTEIRVRKIWKIWRCEIVLLCVGSEARVLCYCATDDVFSSSLHSFMVLSHCLLYHRDQRILSAVVLNLRRCRVVSSHYSIILFYHRARSVAFGSHSYITNSYSSTYILLRGWSLRAELKSSWVSAYSFGPLKCQIHECSHLCSHQDQALVLKTSEYLAAGSIWFRAVNRWA